MKLNLAGVPDRTPLDLSKHFKVAAMDRTPKDEDPNERIQAQGASLNGGRGGGLGDWNEMDWYRRNVYLKKAK